MKRKERDQRIDDISKRLDQLDNEDREVIRPSSANEPVILTEAQLQAYGKRFEEKKTLIEKLRTLAGGANRGRLIQLVN